MSLTRIMIMLESNIVTILNAYVLGKLKYVSQNVINKRFILQT